MFLVRHPVNSKLSVVKFGGSQSYPRIFRIFNYVGIGTPMSISVDCYKDSFLLERLPWQVWCHIFQLFSNPCPFLVFDGFLFLKLSQWCLKPQSSWTSPLSQYDRPQSSPPAHPLPMMSAILFMLLQHQFACNSPPHILLPLHLCSYISHFWNAFPCLFYLANIRPPLKTFPRGLLWYHFPSPPLCGLIRGTFSMFPQRWLEHQWGSSQIIHVCLCSFCSRAGMVFCQFFLYPHAWLLTNQ